MHHVVLVAARRARVHELAAAELREAVRHDEDRRARTTLGDGAVEALRDARVPGVRFEVLVAASGETGEHDDDRERTVAGRHVDRQLADVRVAERVVGEDLAREDADLRPAGESGASEVGAHDGGAGRRHGFLRGR
ncbi:MAG: hypothetical protein R3F34_01135 [Planctomycetota bacterium]